MEQLNQKLIKRKLLELAKTKRLLEVEKAKDRDDIVKALTPKLPTDILNLKTIKSDYGYSSRTIYRYRAKGLKFAKNSSKGFVYVTRGDLENFIKQNLYDR
ncbi:hypothetical protein [Flavobacterium defluvii]|uniref:Helix-turn-helix domain-containing protein n=2 Tax=Flavobacterium TaxID=237 RepID=A0A1M5J3C4_9FLAO|nr:hypothetical protein [Flavobacterium defluvii]SHG34690.1 hypothetical protein SAMN05443663_102587 [Flavobacterium defluvii]